MGRSRLIAPLATALLSSCALLLPFPPPEVESTEAGTCEDDVDNDFDGLVDERDPDCVFDESEASLCADGFDNDRDGLLDYDDVGCWPFARAIVERCARVEGVDLRPFEEPGDWWAGAGTLVDRGDGFDIEPDSNGERALLLLPVVTGAARTLRVELTVVLTEEVSRSSGEPILTIIRGRDVGSDVDPDLSTAHRVVIQTGIVSARGDPISLLSIQSAGGGTASVGAPETGEARATLRIAESGEPQLEVSTATHPLQPPGGTGASVSWSSIDSLRLVLSAPAGVRVRSLRVRTEPAETCEAPPELLAPPLSEPRAVAAGGGTTCVVLGDPTDLEWRTTTPFARSETEGATWSIVASSPDDTGVRSCSGLLWDDERSVFRAACTPAAGGGLVFAESAGCGETWQRAGEVSDDSWRTSRALGYTRLEEQHELWWASDEGLVRRWTAHESFAAALETDEPELLLLEDGGPLVTGGARLNVHRVGRDRFFVRSDGVAVSLVVATGLPGEPPIVREAFDPLLSPSGIIGSFDGGLLSSASATMLPPLNDEAARLLLVYTGSTHCAEGVCGVHAGTARVTIVAP